jgi:Protein of unknown function (DUF3047)
MPRAYTALWYAGRIMPISRRALLVAAAGAVLGRSARPARAGTPVTVEDWLRAPLGGHGVPPGWEKYETPRGDPAYDFTVVEDEGRRALAMRSAGDHSTIAHRVQVDLEATPRLHWQWKVRRFPRGADLRARATSDATGHLFVIWPRFPALLRSRLIGYVWDPALPLGAIVPSTKTGTVTFVVARSGSGEQDRWIEERRDVAADHRRIFGEAPVAPGAIALSIDTNDTRSTAETLFGPITFHTS